MFTTSCVLAMFLATTTAYPSYQTLIPNGDRVPNPCTGGTWPGVGHLLSRGGGARNAFGTAFAAAGHEWTKALCMSDSDGDGMSNGEELGDVHCHWTVEKPSHLSSPKGHPGVCEPLTSPMCASTGFMC